LALLPLPPQCCGMQVLGPGKPLELFYQDSKVKEVRDW